MSHIETQHELGYPRLRELYAMMFGVAEEVVHLETWRRAHDGTPNYVSDSQLLAPDCYSLACTLGWACAYPPFRAEGLRYIEAPVHGNRTGYAAGATFFGVSYQDNEDVQIFGGAGIGLEKDLLSLGEGYRLGFSHKRLALWRIRKFLLLKGAITPQRNAELAAQDGAPE